MESRMSAYLRKGWIGVCGLNHDMNVDFLWLPLIEHTPFSRSSSLPARELEMRTNLWLGQASPKRENQESDCPCSVSSLNHHRWVGLPCEKWLREWERRKLPPPPRAQKFLPYWPRYGGGEKERVVGSFVLIIDQMDQTGPPAGVVTHLPTRDGSCGEHCSWSEI